MFFIICGRLLQLAATVNISREIPRFHQILRGSDLPQTRKLACSFTPRLDTGSAAALARTVCTLNS